MNTPLSFVDVGDQFLIAYACSSWAGPAVHLFTIGHAAELYLKAALLKIQPGTDVTKFGHKIGDLLAKLQSYSPSLLAAYTLRKSAADKWLLNPVGPESFGIDPDYDHYVNNMELYWVSRYLADTKYLLASHKAAIKSFVVVSTGLNEYWQPFFRELRNFLGLPDPAHGHDRLANAATSENFPAQARKFLEKIV